MRLEIERNEMDFGITPIENMFINTYLSIASSDQIKLYLYAFSHAYSNKLENLSNESIARETNMSEGQVLDAWKFWMDEGLVKLEGDKYIFKSLRYGYINQMLGGDETPAKSDYIDVKNIKEDVKFLEAEIKPETKELIENIEEFISLGSDVEIKLNPLEIEKVLKYMDEFKVSPDFIQYAFPLASFERSTKSVHQVMETIRNWMIDGVTSEELLNTYLENKSKNKKKETKLKKKKPATIKDNRMSPEERKKFIDQKLKSGLSFKPTED